MRWIFFWLGLTFCFSGFISRAYCQTPDPLSDLGRDYFDKAQYAPAIHYLKKAVTKHPKNWRTWQLLGDAFARLDLTDDALAAYRTSLKIHPHNAALLDSITQIQNQPIPPVLDRGQAPAPPPVSARPMEVSLYLTLPGYWGNTVDRDIWKNEVSFGLGVFWRVSPLISLGGHFDYYLWVANPAEVALKYSGTDNVSFSTTQSFAKMVQVMPQIRVDLVPEPSPIRPYLILGAGWMNKTFDDVSYSLSLITFPVQNSFSLSWGGGLPLQIDDLHEFFIEYERVESWGNAGTDDFDNFNFGFAIKW
jgi:hypothetical protein